MTLVIMRSGPRPDVGSHAVFHTLVRKSTADDSIMVITRVSVRIGKSVIVYNKIVHIWFPVLC